MLTFNTNLSFKYNEIDIELEVYFFMNSTNFHNISSNHYLDVYHGSVSADT